MGKITKWSKKVYKDKFQRYLMLSLILIGIFLVYQSSGGAEHKGSGDLTVDFFYHPACPHCQAQKPFNKKLMEKYPETNWNLYDITTAEGNKLLLEFAEERGIPRQNARVPATFFGDIFFIGFDTEEDSGPPIENALKDFVAGNKLEMGEIQPEEQKNSITLPFFGEINVLDYSIAMLAVILGIVDGFNPCAMWVLVYLISLIVSIGDRRKIWLIVGSFVLASGILYFLFMTAWLNVFLFVGYFRPLTIVIGLGALFAGAISIRDYFQSKDNEICKTGDFESRQKTMSRMERIVNSPLTIATLFGIIGLAFIVNSIEFVCSSAIPAIFTQVLAISDLSTIQYYGYILLYDFFFILDDLIIFGLAAFAVNTSLGTKYAKYCKIIGGIIMLILGFVLAFMPHLLGG